MAAQRAPTSKLLTLTIDHAWCGRLCCCLSQTFEADITLPTPTRQSPMLRKEGRKSTFSSWFHITCTHFPSDRPTATARPRSPSSFSFIPGRPTRRSTDHRTDNKCHTPPLLFSYAPLLISDLGARTCLSVLGRNAL